MKRLSIRHKIAEIEDTKSGIGVSTSARKYIRQIRPDMAGIRNELLNELIANNFSSAEPVHRFKTKSGELAEIRKSKNEYYIAVIRGRGEGITKYDIIVIQPTMKNVSEKIRKKRFEPGWGSE